MLFGGVACMSLLITGISMPNLLSPPNIILIIIGAYAGWRTYKDIRLFNYLEDVLVESLRERPFWKEANKWPVSPTPEQTSTAIGDESEGNKNL